VLAGGARFAMAAMGVGAMLSACSRDSSTTATTTSGSVTTGAPVTTTTVRPSTTTTAPTTATLERPATTRRAPTTTTNRVVLGPGVKVRDVAALQVAVDAYDRAFVAAASRRPPSPDDPGLVATTTATGSIRGYARQFMGDLRRSGVALRPDPAGATISDAIVSVLSVLGTSAVVSAQGLGARAGAGHVAPHRGRPVRRSVAVAGDLGAQQGTCAGRRRRVRAP
jgi:hypothetical protein